MNIARQLAREKVAQKHEPANKRVKVVIEEDWKEAREEKFSTAIKFSAVAKANRTASYVTQAEVGEEYGVTAQRVGRWESGHYFGWTDKKLEHYLKVVFRLARSPR